MLYTRETCTVHKDTAELSQTENSQITSAQTKSRTRPARQFPKAAETKCPKLVGSKQQKFVLPQFWRPEVRDRGVGRVGSFWRLGGNTCSGPLPSLLGTASNPWGSLACGHITPISASVFTGPSPVCHSNDGP